MILKIKQQFVPYHKWEDFISGMWRKLPKEQEPKMIQQAIEFTGDWRRYGEAMGKVISAWPLTMLNSLSNPSLNRRAFVGHCACQFEFNCPEYITRMAWKRLNEKQQTDADAIAEYHIKNWEKEYARKNKKLYQNVGVQMLLTWDSR